LIKNNFGKNANIIRKDDVILLNHIGSEDQMEEIIFYGKSIGIRRYDPFLKKWIIKLNANGLPLLKGRVSKRWVKVENGAIKPIINGANVLIPGVIDADKEIRKGDYIVVMDKNDNIIAGAIAKINEIDRKNMERGVYAKNYTGIKETFPLRKEEISWEEIIKWNERELKKLEKKAIEYIKETIENFQLPVIVSYSGGKDSLVTLALVQKANVDFKVLFIDTGIEFPETVKYVKESSIKLQFSDKLIIEKSPSKLFWSAFEKFGPPGRDYRYCCKFAKLAPVQRAIEKLFKEQKCLSFVGQRRYESFRRSVGDIWENQYITNQINVSPIQNWTAIMIWLYIWWKKLPYNPLYDDGYERIGCWVCPSSDMLQFKLLKENHPKLFAKLFRAVHKWMEKRKLPETYWDYGLWRFKKLPKKIVNNISFKEDKAISSSKDLRLTAINFEVHTCKTKPLAVIGVFSHAINLEETTNFLSMLGKVQYNQKLQIIKITNKDHSILFYKDGTFKIIFKKQTNTKVIQKTIQNFTDVVFRSLECLNCGLCILHCKYNAITLVKEKITINEQLCAKCLQCSNICPVVTIINKNVKQEIKKIFRKDKTATDFIELIQKR